MNCTDIARLLDERDLGDLPAADRAAAANHLRTCADCAGEWRAFERVAASALAEVPAALPGRIWGLVATARPARREKRRERLLLLLGGILMVAGAAAVMSWRSAETPGRAANTTRVDSETVDITSAGGAPVARNDATQALPRDDVGRSPGAGGSAGAAAETDARETFRLIVLPTELDNASPIAADSAETIEAVLVRVLDSLPGLDIVEAGVAALAGAGLDESALENLSTDEQDRIARHFDSDFVMRVRSRALREGTPPDWWIVSVTYRDRRGYVERRDTATPSAPSIDPDGWPIESQGAHLAREIYTHLFPDRAAAVWEAVITDTRQSPAERLRALRSITPAEVGSAAIASIVEMTPLIDPQARAQTWTLLAELRHPDAARPLTDALLYDSEVEVRLAAADGLRGYRDVPTVAAALESAAAGDPSEAVRARARMAALPDGERARYVAAALRDPSRSVAQRLAPLLLAQGPTGPALSSDLLETLDEIARRDADPAARIAALKEFGYSGESRFLSSIVDALHNDPESAVRSAAIAALRHHQDVANARRAEAEREAAERAAARRASAPPSRSNAARATVAVAARDPSAPYGNALLRALRSDRDPGIRRQAAQRLPSVTANPNLIGSLESALRDEQDETVKAAIASALTRARDAGPPR